MKRQHSRAQGRNTQKWEDKTIHAPLFELQCHLSVLSVTMLRTIPHWSERMKIRVRETPSASCCGSQTTSWWCWNNENRHMPSASSASSSVSTSSLWLLTLSKLSCLSIARNVTLCSALAICDYSLWIPGFPLWNSSLNKSILSPIRLFIV